LYEGSYNYLQGLWALEQGNPEAAALYFDYSLTQHYKKAQLYQAIAFSEMGDLPRAYVAWDSLSHAKDAGERQIGIALKQVLTVSPAELMTMEDPVKYQFCHYRLTPFDTLVFDRIIVSMTQPLSKGWALFEMARRQFKWDNEPLAAHYLSRISREALSDQTLKHEVQRLQLLMMASDGNFVAIREMLKTDFVYFREETVERLLMEAHLLASAQDTVKAAVVFRKVGGYNPYFDEGVLAAADFFRNHGTDPMLSYTILADAIQVNTTSPKLFQAYINEANRVGFDWYAASAMEQLQDLIKRTARRE